MTLTLALASTFLVVTAPANAHAPNNSVTLERIDPDYPHVEILDARPAAKTLVKSNLPWSSASIRFALSAIHSQKERIDKVLAFFRQREARIVKLVSDPQVLSGPAYRDSSHYVYGLHPWHLEAFDSTGKLVAKSKQFPTDPYDLANYVVRPFPKTCSLDQRQWWNPFTWFGGATCEVPVPTADQYLRASLATAMKKASIEDAGSWLVPQLDYALSSNCELRIQANALICDALSDIVAGTTSISLAAQTKLGGYKITVDIKSRKATFEATGFDQVALAREAAVLPGENFVRFF